MTQLSPAVIVDVLQTLLPEGWKIVPADLKSASHRESGFDPRCEHH